MIPARVQWQSSPNPAAAFLLAPQIELPQPSAGRTKTIEDVAVGDLVWAWDEARMAPVRRKVVRLYRHKAKPILEVLLTSGSRDQTITATMDHPFWVESRGWTAASQLAAGARLKLLNPASGEEWLVVSIDVPGRKDNVFNFEVDGEHNYFVGRVGVLVHNSSDQPPSDTLRPSFFREEPIVVEAAPFSEPAEVGGFFSLLKNGRRRPIELGDKRTFIRGDDRFTGNLLDSNHAFEERARVLDPRLNVPTLRAAELASGDMSRGSPFAHTSAVTAVGATELFGGDPLLCANDHSDVPPTIRSPSDPTAHASDGMGRRFDIVDSGTRERRVASQLGTPVLTQAYLESPLYESGQRYLSSIKSRSKFIDPAKVVAVMGRAASMLPARSSSIYAGLAKKFGSLDYVVDHIMAPLFHSAGNRQASLPHMTELTKQGVYFPDYVVSSMRDGLSQRGFPETKVLVGAGRRLTDQEFFSIIMPGHPVVERIDFRDFKHNIFPHMLQAMAFEPGEGPVLYHDIAAQFFDSSPSAKLDRLKSDAWEPGFDNNKIGAFFGNPETVTSILSLAPLSAPLLTGYRDAFISTDRNVWKP